MPLPSAYILSATYISARWRMLLIVILEGNRQIMQRRFSIWLRHVCHVISLDRPHEILRHTVALRTAYLRGHRLQAGLHPGVRIVVASLIFSEKADWGPKEYIRAELSTGT